MTQHYLSRTQELIWIGQELNPTEPLYNMVVIYTIHDQIDIKRFKEAFNRLIKESESLRLIFERGPEGVIQRITPPQPYAMDVVDASAQKDFDIRAWAKKRGKKELNLSETTFDSALIKQAENKFTWYLNQHHIATDVSSFNVLYNRLAELYADLDSASVLPSFVDYLNQKESKNSAKNKGNQAQKSDISKEELKPFGKPIPKSISGKSSRISIPISEPVLAKLETLLESTDYRMISGNMALLNFFYSAYSVFLDKIMGAHVLVGLPTHNRQSGIEKRMPGLLMDVVSTEPTKPETDTFRTLYAKNKDVILNYLFASQSEKIDNPNDKHVHALLNFITTTFGPFNGCDAETKWLHNDYHDAQHWIRLHVQQLTGGGIELEADLNDTVFSEDQRIYLGQTFSRLIESAIEHDQLPINQWDFVAAEESKNIQSRIKLPIPEKPKSAHVLELFLKHINENPESIAIKSGRDKLTYSALNEGANQLANFLQSKGLQAGERVGVLIEPSALFVKSILALLKCNAVFVPIDAAYPQKRIAYLLEKSKARFLLTTTKHLEKVGETASHKIDLSAANKSILRCNKRFSHQPINTNDLAYILFTSGSTGLPKGVKISHGNVSSYLNWAQELYKLPGEKAISSAFFTSVGFDLSYTSLFLPLVTGGIVHPYHNFEGEPIDTLKSIFEKAEINFVKLTPAHAQLMHEIEVRDRTSKTLILGGEQLTTSTANQLLRFVGKSSQLFNEYGPTEATIGSIIYKQAGNEDSTNVPIGKVAPGLQAIVLDENQKEVPVGVVGELYLSGAQLASGYEDESEQTQAKFIKLPNRGDAVFYITGDLVRINENWDFEYLGRTDTQLKIGSRRIEKEEIEHALNLHPRIKSSVILPKSFEQNSSNQDLSYCTNCGLPDNYPYIDFNEQGLCEICEKYETYHEHAEGYFKTKKELFDLLGENSSKQYDCMVLLSGGKDSSFALAKLAQQNLRILAFTLDNGFLSKEAMDNIDRVVDHLEVDHVWGSTEAMNEIFVDSLNRYANVCDGCFKTIYTLAIKLALEKEIPFIVTGLSRGQFFETRLSEELFLKESIDFEAIDDSILEARKAYHKVDDAVKRLITPPELLEEETFNTVQFIDFYRYYDVSYDEMMDFLTHELPWLRPKDTGRSTNCLINELGIYVHKNKRGYHNYALPYSWDVRLGHKTREQAIEEFNDHFEEPQIMQMASDIGYADFSSNQQQLFAFYTTDGPVGEAELHAHLSEHLPDYMIPSYFKQVGEIPLTNHGKVDYEKLAQGADKNKSNRPKFVEPRNDIEAYLADLWANFLQVEKVSVFDNFIELGGHSIVAIRILARLERDINIKVPLGEIFEHATVAQMAGYLEQKMEEGLAS